MPDYFEYGATEIDYLKRKDKLLAAVIDEMGHLERAVNPNLFDALIAAIVDQQISRAAAITVNARLRALCGGVYQAEKIAALSQTQIQACGMTMRKAGYILNAAQVIARGEIDLDALETMDDESVIKALSSLHGVGVWTAEMLLIFSLQRPNVLSWGDLAIQRGIMRLYHHKTLPKARFERYRKRYAPYGSVASIYLWALAK